MTAAENENGTDKPSIIGPIVAVMSVALMLACWAAGSTVGLNMMAVVVISIVIWQACDPFADAAQWIGDQWNLPGSVRGATLDAIASSLPELFTGIFFVIVAMTADGEKTQAEASGEGYGSVVATCAGSAVYNMILIPAFVAFVISFARKNRPTVDVEEKVIARDGVAFLLCSVILLVFLFGNQLHWWMGVIFIGVYFLYIFLLYGDWKRFEAVKSVFDELGLDATVKEVHERLASTGSRYNMGHVGQVKQELERRGEEEEDEADEAGLFFGYVDMPLNGLTAWTTIAVATAIAAGACYFLVEATNGLARDLEVPAFFMAVIVAAAASSVPDTFISIGAALRGDDSGAVSNAFGSNIFDICICLGIPLILNCGLNDWQPISLLQDGKPMAGLVGLRILLAVLTVITLAVMWHNRQLTRNKAIFLCLLYCVFIAYAVVGSLGWLAV